MGEIIGNILVWGIFFWLIMRQSVLLDYHCGIIIIENKERKFLK